MKLGSRLMGLPVLAAALSLAEAGGTQPEAPSAQDQFESLVKEIGSLRADLENLDRQERSLVNEMDRLSVQSAISGRELARLGLMRGRAGAELDQTRLQLQARRADVRREEEGLAAQLRTAYEVGRSREIRLALSLDEPVDVMRAIAYLDVMARRQSGMVASLNQGRAEMEALERALQVQSASLEELTKQERARAGELEEIRSRSRSLLESTRSERESHRRAIGELTRAAEELEQAIVAGDAGGALAGPTSAPPIDVERLRGAMEWPVPGEIASGFGDIKDVRFGTVTPHPGIDIRTTPGEQVKSILPGRVVFSRRFSGYGNSVLVDHGGHYLSVYARLAFVGVVEGQEVLTGQTLGTAADSAFDGGPPTIYFELRQQGRAVDPAGWLKRRAATRREEGR